MSGTKCDAAEGVEMRARKWIPVVLPFSVGLAGSKVYSTLIPSTEAWGQVLGSLYYIPIVIAAIALGTPAAVFVAVAAGAAHTFAAALGHGDPWIEPAAQTLLFLCVAMTAAKLAQWRTSDLNATVPGNPPEQPVVHAFQNFTAGAELWPLSGAIIGLVRQFRTPLTSIEGAGWILEDAHLPDQKRRELVG